MHALCLEHLEEGNFILYFFRFWILASPNSYHITFLSISFKFNPVMDGMNLQRHAATSTAIKEHHISPGIRKRN